jgi:hypothetical protein
MPTTDFNLLVSSSVQADTGNTLTLKGAMADGVSAIGTVVGSSVTLANATAKLLSVTNNAVEKAYIDYTGKLRLEGACSIAGLVTSGTGFSAGNSYFVGAQFYGQGPAASANATGNLIGQYTNVAGAVGTSLDNVTALTDATAKLVSIRNATVEKTYIAKDGAVNVTGVASGAIAYSMPQGSWLSFTGAGTYLTSAGAGDIRTSAATNFICMGTLQADLIKDANGVGALTLSGTMADGASAIGVTLKSNATFANATSKLVSISNGAAEKAYITKDGDFVGAADIGTKLVGQPLWRCLITAASTVPKDNTDSPSSTYTLTAGQVVMLQSDVLTYVEIVASASMTAAGAKAITLEANEKFYWLVKSANLKVSVDCPSGSCNVKLFTLET